MRSSHRLLALTTGLLMAFSAAGCASGDQSGDSGAAGGGSPVGAWGSTAAQSPNLTFTDDGTVSGSDGCNRLSGSWTQDGETVKLGQMVSTLKACPGVDTWLTTAVSATVDGDTLRISDEGGTEIGTLERAKD